MNTITFKKGQKMAPSIFNLHLSTDPNFNVTPEGNEEIRYRCYFEKGGKIIIHLTPKEERGMLGLPISHFEELFLYGAFGTTLVKQVKIFGKISELLYDDQRNYRTIVHKRLSSDISEDELLKLGDKLPIKPTPEEVARAVQYLNVGMFIKFTPKYYEVGGYVVN